MYSKCLQLDHLRTLVILFTTMKGSSLPNIHLIDSKCRQLDHSYQNTGCNYYSYVRVQLTKVSTDLLRMLVARPFQSIGSIFYNCERVQLTRDSSDLLKILLDFLPLKTLSFAKLKSLRPYSKPFIFFVTYKWPNKLECYITLEWKRLSSANTLAYWAHHKSQRK